MMTRSFLAVIAGYLVFAIPSALLFRTTGVDPREMASAQFLILSTIFGMVFACAGGYVAARISGRRPRLHAAIVAGILAVIAVASMIAEFRSSSIWSQIVALAFMAPSAAAGGIAAA